MRILHLDPDDIANPLSGGGPVRTLEIYRRLAQRHEVTVLTPTFPGSTPELVRDGIRYIRLGRKVGDHGSSHHLTFLAALPQAVRRYPYDLLVEDTMPPFSATWTPLFRRRAVPLIGSVQWWFAREYTRRLKLPFHWGEQYGIRLYDKLVVLTEQMRHVIADRHPSAQCKVIPNGIDAALFDIAPQVGSYILYIGRIEVHAKGLDLLLKALASLPDATRPILMLAGGGPADELRAVDELLQLTGMRPWVRLLGKVDALRRANLLRDCRFTVMPSRSETFGMTIAEANAAGKISLVFDAGPMNEVVAPYGPRVPAFDWAAYGQAMEWLMGLADKELLTMGDSCRQWARRYDWNTVAAEQESFYLEVKASYLGGRYTAGTQ